MNDEQAKRERREMFAKLLAGETDDDNDGVTRIEKANRDRGGPHNLVGALVRHLHDALDRKRERHGYQKSAKDHTMDTEQHLDSILKDFGPIALAKYIADSDHAPCTEGEFVQAVTRHAQAAHPNLTKEQAFAKLYETESVWRACAVLHAAPFTKGGPYSFVDTTPMVVSGVVREATGATVYTKSADPTPNADTAYAELMRKAEEYREAHPESSISQAFDKVYTAPANIELAKRERMESAPR